MGQISFMEIKLIHGGLETGYKNLGRKSLVVRRARKQ
jgi:hypothetical protein